MANRYHAVLIIRFYSRAICRADPRICERGGGVYDLPFLSPSSPLTFLPRPFPPPLELVLLKPARVFRERCSSPSGVRGAYLYSPVEFRTSAKSEAVIGRVHSIYRSVGRALCSVGHLHLTHLVTA